MNLRVLQRCESRVVVSPLFCYFRGLDLYRPKTLLESIDHIVQDDNVYSYFNMARQDLQDTASIALSLAREHVENEIFREKSTLDEVAIIKFYSMPLVDERSSFYFSLNSALKSGNPELIKPFVQVCNMLE